MGCMTHVTPVLWRGRTVHGPRPHPRRHSGSARFGRAEDVPVLALHTPTVSAYVGVVAQPKPTTGRHANTKMLTHVRMTLCVPMSRPMEEADAEAQVQQPTQMACGTCMPAYVGRGLPFDAWTCQATNTICSAGRPGDGPGGRVYARPERR